MRAFTKTEIFQEFRSQWFGLAICQVVNNLFACRPEADRAPPYAICDCQFISNFDYSTGSIHTFRVDITVYSSEETDLKKVELGLAAFDHSVLALQNERIIKIRPIPPNQENPLSGTMQYQGKDLTRTSTSYMVEVQQPRGAGSL